MKNIELISNLLVNYYNSFDSLTEHAELENSINLSSFHSKQALKINVPIPLQRETVNACK